MDTEKIKNAIISHREEFQSYVNEVNNTSSIPLDELIYRAKKHIHKFDLDEITNRELQRFLAHEVEGLYRRKFHWNEIIEEINDYESLLERQYIALHSKTLRYSSLAGILMMGMHIDFLVATVSAILVGAATYISGKKEIKKNENFRQYIIGTYDYHQRLLEQLHNNIIAEKNADKQ